MKKLLPMICGMLMMIPIACAKDKVTRDEGILPTEAREFIKQYFPQSSVLYLKVDKNMFRLEGYDVRLSDGTELEFDRKGQWTDVECKGSVVPASIIPDVIQIYLKENYNSYRVKGIKHKRWGYELKLNSGLEVEFDNQGNFLRLDD